MVMASLADTDTSYMRTTDAHDTDITTGVKSRVPECGIGRRHIRLLSALYYTDMDIDPRHVSTNKSKVVGFRTVAEMMACEDDPTRASIAATRGGTSDGSYI